MAKLTNPDQLPQEVEHALEELRAAHALRTLTDDESGTGVDRLPGGVYGFTYSPALANSPLFKDRDLRSYEGHKLADGSVILLGFLTPSDKEAFESNAGRVTLHLFAEPTGDADQLASIPVSRIENHVEYSQRGGQGLEIVVLG